MTERVTNADIAVSLAEIKKDIGHIKGVLGNSPKEGLQGDVAMLIGIKNKGWGFITGLLLLAGGLGAGLKSVLGEMLK